MFSINDLERYELRTDYGHHQRCSKAMYDTSRRGRVLDNRFLDIQPDRHRGVRAGKSERSLRALELCRGEQQRGSAVDTAVDWEHL